VFVLTGFDVCVVAIICVSSRSRNDLKNKRINRCAKYIFCFNELAYNKTAFSFTTLLNPILKGIKDMQMHFPNFEKSPLIWLKVLLK